MGLDITFYKENKFDTDSHEEVGYFRKVNFLLTYFNATKEEDNCRKIYITKDEFKQFIADLNDELANRNHDSLDGPINEKLKTVYVFFGGPVDYDEWYWEDVKAVRNWAQEFIEGDNIDWENDNLYMIAWW